jgi:hypothetical protein
MPERSIPYGTVHAVTAVRRVDGCQRMRASLSVGAMPGLYGGQRRRVVVVTGGRGTGTEKVGGRSTAAGFTS